jgi:hypothetical protein
MMLIDEEKKRKKEKRQLTLIALFLIYTIQSILTMCVGCSKINLFALILMIETVSESNLRKAHFSSVSPLYDINDAYDCVCMSIDGIS